MASGELYSYKYGFGVLDGYRYVTAAQSWNLVKPQAWFASPTIQLNSGAYSHNKYTGGQPIVPSGVESKLVVTKEMVQEGNFEKLEHVNVKVWIDHSRRGDVQVELISPKGIKSVLAKPRPKDEATTGFPGWTFMSVKHWGEDPIGEWTLRVSDQNDTSHTGSFLGWNMMFWGSTIDASKAKKYELQPVEDVLPPIGEHIRPVIPDSPPSAVAFAPTSTSTMSAVASATSTLPPYASLLPNMNHWVSEMVTVACTHKWYSFGFSLILVLSIGGVLYLLCRPRRLPPPQMTTSGYSAVSDMEAGPVMVTAGPRTVGMMRDEGPPGRSGAGLGFHSAFLDDDEMSTAQPTAAGRYRDVPVPEVVVTPARESMSLGSARK
jgi:kexin